MLSRFGFLAALTAAALPLTADTPMTRLRVEVLSHGGRPVDRAAVIVDFVEGRAITKLGKKVMKHWEVRTNQEGVAKVPALPQGTMRVQVIAKGYQTFGQTYEVNEEEKTLTIKLNPPQPQHSEHQ
jgi:hypothetical protein